MLKLSQTWSSKKQKSELNHSQSKRKNIRGRLYVPPRLRSRCSDCAVGWMNCCCAWYFLPAKHPRWLWTRPPCRHCALGIISLGHSSSSSAKITKEWTCTRNSTVCVHGVSSNNFTLLHTLLLLMLKLLHFWSVYQPRSVLSPILTHTMRIFSAQHYVVICGLSYFSVTQVIQSILLKPESSLPFVQEPPTSLFWAWIIQSSPFHSISLEFILILFPIYAYVFKIVSFLTNQNPVRIYPLLLVAHAPSIPSSLMCSSEQIQTRSTNSEARHYGVFSGPLLVPPFWFISFSIKYEFKTQGIKR